MQKITNKTTLCPNCGRAFEVSESQITKYEIAWNIDGKETLAYSATCPRCGQFVPVEENNLPEEYLEAFKEEQKIDENINISNKEIKQTKIKAKNRMIFKQKTQNNVKTFECKECGVDIALNKNNVQNFERSVLNGNKFQTKCPICEENILVDEKELPKNLVKSLNKEEKQKAKDFVVKCEDCNGDILLDNSNFEKFRQLKTYGTQYQVKCPTCGKWETVELADLPLYYAQKYRKFVREVKAEEFKIY